MLPELDMFTIETPADHPGQVVVRRHVIVDGAPTTQARPIYEGASLEDARRAVPPGRQRVQRHTGDKAHIVEFWW